MNRYGRILLSGLLVLILALGNGAALAEEAASAYPIAGAEGITLTFAKIAQTQITSQYDSLQDTPLMQAYMEATGVNIEVITPADNTAMNLLFASGDLPDMVYFDWDAYAGGISKAISDGIVLPLNDLLETYAPDAYAMMTRTDSIYRQCTTDDGTFYAFIPVVNSTSIPNGNTIDKVQDGPIIRADWLEEFGMSVPTTIAEYEAYFDWKCRRPLRTGRMCSPPSRSKRVRRPRSHSAGLLRISCHSPVRSTLLRITIWMRAW